MRNHNGSPTRVGAFDHFSLGIAIVSTRWPPGKSVMLRFAVLMMTVASVSAGVLACGAKRPRSEPRSEPRSDAIVHAVAVSPQNATVKTGERVELAASVVAGADVTERSVTWSSSNLSIAAVSQAGLVTAGNVTGAVTITAASKADTNIAGASTINVVP